MEKKQEQQVNHKAALTHSILNYLQKNGFSKTFKRFLKEAQMKEDNLTTSIDLEDVYSRYFESSKDAEKQSKTHKEQDFTMENGAAELSEEAASKKKKKKEKKGLENDEGNGKGESEETSKLKDKKDKHKSKSVSVVEDDQKLVKDNKAIDIPVEDCKTETNKRKKKKEVEVSQKASDKGEEMVDQGKPLEASEDGTKKKSKKRKLSASDESEIKNMEKSESGESKRRKTEDSEEAKVGVQQGNLNEQKNGCSDQEESLKLSNKEVDGSTKGDHKDNGIQKSGTKSARKQQNSSAEPKTTANAFQRVKADEVEFVDERLQDNSYWAKAGADNGYGAKAQEILGQVKGRYGDLDNHSSLVKFILSFGYLLCRFFHGDPPSPKCYHFPLV